MRFLDAQMIQKLAGVLGTFLDAQAALRQGAAVLAGSIVANELVFFE